MQKIKQKVVAIFILILVFSNPFSKVLAVTVAQNGSSLSYLKDGSGDALEFAVKKASDGRFAYCIEHKKTTPSGQDFTKGGAINNGITYILKNGYPNVSFTGDWKKDYYITQTAVHYYLGEVQWIVYANGEAAIKDNIFSLVDRARNANSSSEECSIAISPQTQKFYQDGDYFVTNRYSINKTGNLQDYDIVISGAPLNTEIVNKTDTGFNLRVHKSNITQANYNIKITINSKFEKQEANTYYTTSTSYQKVVMLDVETIYKDIYNGAEANLEAYAELKIVKRDVETNKPINGTIFNITSGLGYNNTVTVDGELLLTELVPTTYIIKEIASNENYILDLTEHTIILNPLDKKEIYIENEHKKGQVEIIKYDKDDIEQKLEGVEFEIRDTEDKTVANLITDGNGYAISPPINIGDYTLVETKALKNFRIAKDEIINIKYNEILHLELENEKCKGFIKIIKVDKDNNEIKLEGVQFLVLDNKGHIVDFLKTDVNGEAISKELPVGNYVIKEISTNKGYILSSESQIVLVSEKETTEIEIDNEKEKIPETAKEVKKLPKTGE